MNESTRIKRAFERNRKVIQRMEGVGRGTATTRVRVREGMRIVDLGCGTGELTRSLHEVFRAAETIGFDSSPAMLEKAAAHAGFFTALAEALRKTILIGVAEIARTGAGLFAKSTHAVRSTLLCGEVAKFVAEAGEAGRKH